LWFYPVLLLAALLKRLHPTVTVAGPPPHGSARNYGSHLAMSMALGLLFMGGGRCTFGTDNASVAALVIALYPHFPVSTSDNRCHLQVRADPHHITSS
jgi:anaphase-promoting complex subunit 1